MRYPAIVLMSLAVLTAVVLFKVEPKSSAQVAVELPQTSRTKTQSAIKISEPVVEKPAKQQMRLIIPQIGVNAPMIGMGKTPDGSKMAVPDNFTEVGWYNLAAKPGEVGSAVLGAHVDNGGSVPGVFKRLKDLKAGDEFTVTSEEGKPLAFRVSEIKIYDRNEKNTSEVFNRNDKPRLNLITCYGTWLPAENTYAQRIVVFSELI